jgi:ribosomal protein L7/L12
MTTPSQPLADVSEFALPGRMRELAARILWDLINPCRQQLMNVEKKRDDAIIKAQGQLAEVDTEVKAMENGHQGRHYGVVSKVSAAVREVDQICVSAAAHLNSQNLEIPSLRLRSSESTGDVPPGLDLDAVLGQVEPRKRELQYLCANKKLAYWPKNDAGRVAIGCGSIIFLFVFWPLAIFWPVVVFVARLVQASTIKRDYQSLAESSQVVQASLKEIATRSEKEANDAIRTDKERLLPPAKRVHAAAVEAANQTFKENVQKIGNDFRQVAEQLHTDVNQLWEDSRYAAKEWDSSEWKDWSPDPSPEFAARIGTLTISADDLQTQLARVDFNFRLPALIPFAEGRCLLFNAKGEAKDAAAEAMQSAAIRALANTPPGKARFTLIDPVGLGQNVADFMHLGDFNRDLINGKAWTEPQHIEQQLTKLTEDMETVIQTFLRKNFASIQEYNKEHHEVAEPFRFLVIFDFPVNFTDSAARRLVSIVKNGPRCGVYTLILMDSSKKLPYGFNIEDLRQLAVIFESEGTVSRSRSNKDEHVPAQPAPSSKEQDVFAVVLKSVPADKKIAVIKALRSIKNGLGLANAKMLVESAPKRILDGVTKGEANAAKRELEEAGAIVGVGEAPTSSDSPPPQEVEIGKTYRGKVVTIKEFGAFVEFLSGKDGLVHISELANFRVKQTEDIVKLGDEIWVKCLGVDEKGRVRLSRKAAMAERETNLAE